MKKQYLFPSIHVENMCPQASVLSTSPNQIGVGGQQNNTPGDAPMRRLSTMYI